MEEVESSARNQFAGTAHGSTGEMKLATHTRITVPFPEILPRSPSFFVHRSSSSFTPIPRTTLTGFSPLKRSAMFRKVKEIPMTDDYLGAMGFHISHDGNEVT